MHWNKQKNETAFTEKWGVSKAIRDKLGEEKFSITGSNTKKLTSIVINMSSQDVLQRFSLYHSQQFKVKIEYLHSYAYKYTYIYATYIY